MVDPKRRSSVAVFMGEGPGQLWTPKHTHLGEGRLLPTVQAVWFWAVPSYLNNQAGKFHDTELYTSVKCKTEHCKIAHKLFLLSNLAAKCRKHWGQCCQGNMATWRKAAFLHISNSGALKAFFPLQFPNTTKPLGHAMLENQGILYCWRLSSSYKVKLPRDAKLPQFHPYLEPWLEAANFLQKKLSVLTYLHFIKCSREAWRKNNAILAEKITLCELIK